jgi:hypothetical protein
LIHPILTACGITLVKDDMTQLTQAMYLVGARFYGQDTPGTYTWTVPAGCYALNDAEIWGGGGGGGGAGGASAVGQSAGVGGNGSGYALGNIAVMPGQTITVIVGTGGTGGGGAGTSGSAGGTSSIAVNGTIVLQATGGAGGPGASSGAAQWPSGAPYGTPGVGSGSAASTALTAGGTANAFTTGSGNPCFGSGGGSAPFGGSATPMSAASGFAGEFPGGGGGGAANNSAPVNGGTGSPGYVRWKY